MRNGAKADEVISSHVVIPAVEARQVAVDNVVRDETLHSVLVALITEIVDVVVVCLRDHKSSNINRTLSQIDHGD